MQKTVWQNATCTAFYRKNMTKEVTSLSPEPVTWFILSRKWFRLSDYHLLVNGRGPNEDFAGGRKCKRQPCIVAIA